jgi:hypothetical protein
MTTAREDLISMSDYVGGRLRQRLSGLTDEEYYYEPVPDCRTVRPVGDGTFRSDGHRTDEGDPREFTTLAWRLAHIIDLLTEDRIAAWLAVDGAPDWPDRGDPGTAAAALDALDRALAHWHAVLDATTDDSLAELLGPIGGPYAEATRRAFVLHIFDELVHHGAETALMRDLYAASRGKSLAS